MRKLFMAGNRTGGFMNYITGDDATRGLEVAGTVCGRLDRTG
jgi:hypothetical protein